MKFPGWVGGSYESQAPMADVERTVNLFMENVEVPSGTSRKVLLRTPGVELITATNSTQGRAHIFLPTALGVGREFSVMGSSLIEWDSDGVPTFRGAVAIDTSPATISSNGDGGGELFITSGGNGYIFTLATNVLTTISALNGKATQGDQLDGYFLALDATTGTLYSSELLDGATWTTGTMFVQRNAAPDPWIAMKVKGPYIYLFGEQTGEVWYDAGSSPFPFAKHPSGLMPYGIAASWSLRVADDSLMWIGSSASGRGFPLRATGFSAEVAAPYPVQAKISGYGVVSDAYADSYSDGGHTFYVVGFPSADKTWMFDLQTSTWTELGTWVTGAFDYSFWRPRCHAFAFGEHRWLHSTGTGLYRASRSIYTDVDALPIRWLRRGPTLEDENNRLFCSAFELDIEPGLGLVSGQGENPQVMLRISRDGGKTWGPERSRSAGKRGQYGTRVRWDRCGSGRRMVFEASGTDPVPVRISNAYVEIAGEIDQRGAA